MAPNGGRFGTSANSKGPECVINFLSDSAGVLSSCQPLRSAKRAWG